MTLSKLMVEKPVLAAATTLASLVALGTLYKYLRTDAIVRVKKLVIYPVKSLRGVYVDELEITPTGAKYGVFHDRMFVLLSAANVVITQRVKPKLSLIHVSLHGHEIWLKAPNMDVLKLNTLQEANIESSELIGFELWNQATQGIEYSRAASEWFSSYLGADVRLVKYHEGLLKRSTLVQTPNSVENDPDSKIIYQDGNTFLLINDDSVADLNGRLARADRLDHSHFRPNILIENAPAYSEDAYDLFKIGSVIFKNVKQCERCTLTTVIPSKGEKHPQLEPLKTLKTYRVNEELKHLYKDSPLLGIGLKPVQTGYIRVKDVLTF